MFDDALANKFIEHIGKMTDDEIYNRAENAPDCGMGAVINEWPAPKIEEIINTE